MHVVKPVLPSNLSPETALRAQRAIPHPRNNATRFISPTKTLEYLAGGKPVVSTPIRDVVHLYGHLAMVRIAAEANEFVQSEEFLDQGVEPDWLSASDRLLAQNSWDCTWSEMEQQLQAVVAPQKEQV